MLALTISEAAVSRGISRNAIWLAIRRGELAARKTSGGLWLIEEDDKWAAYSPRKDKGAGSPRDARRTRGD
jgi:excisionase family DNA binding protein